MKREEKAIGKLVAIIILWIVLISAILLSCSDPVEPDCNCSFEIRESAKWTDFEWETVAFGDYPGCIEPDSIVIIDTVLTVNRYPYQKIRVESCIE